MRVLVLKKSWLTRVLVVVCLTLVSFAYARAAIGDEGLAVYSNAKPKPKPVYRVDVGGERKIAISFDAAWGAERTAGILDILDQHSIKSTFFLVGFWIDKYPEKVKLIAERGHEIGNHSLTHPHFTEITDDKIKQEVSGTSDKIFALTGVRPTLFRPPYGDYNDRVIETLRGEGYTPIQWDVDSLDWKEKGVDNMVKQVTSRVQNGSIVLFHNNSRDILEALPIILTDLDEKGFTIVPISELLLAGDTYVDRQGIQRAR